MDYNKAALEMHETHKGKVGDVYKRQVNASFNYERQMSQGAQYALSPILQKLYPDKKELGEAHAENKVAASSATAVSLNIFFIIISTV